MTGSLAPLSRVAERGLPSDTQNVLIFAVGLLGVLFCAIRYITTTSCRQLISSKFKVVHEIEQQLPFACDVREWELLSRREKRRIYWPPTSSSVI
jgi:hypothetical protein